MNEFEKNNASELLTQLLDGELESVNEPALFSAMATDKDLFDELKQHLAIRDAIRKDTEAFTPPQETVNAVFTSLGYRAPGNAPLPVAMISKSADWGKYLRRAVPFALLLIGLVGSYSIFNSTSEVKSADSKLIKSGAKIETVSIKSVKTSVPVIASSEKIKSSNNAVIIKHTAGKKPTNLMDLYSENIAVNNSVIISKDKFVSPVMMQELNSKIESVSLSSTVYYHVKPPYFKSSYSTINQNVNIVPLRIGNSDDIKVYYKNKGVFKSEPFLTNFNVGVSFLNKANLKIGIEFGLQNYNVNISDKNDVILEESRNVTWIGASFRYELQEISFSNCTPYGQASIALCDFGKYLSMASVGVEFIPFDKNFGINFGAEYSNLWYSTLGIPYSTNSLLFSIGCSFKF
jgi:hypothetical protein